MADRRLLQRSMAVCCKYCWVCCSSAAHGRDMLKSSGRPSIPGISQQNHWNIITISIKCTTNNNFLKFYSDLKNKSFGITETWILILEPTSSNSVHIVIICGVVHVITILILSIWNRRSKSGFIRTKIRDLSKISWQLNWTTSTNPFIALPCSWIYCWYALGYICWCICARMTGGIPVRMGMKCRREVL